MSPESSVETETSIANQLYEAVIERVKNPLTLPFLISFFFVNYEIIFQLFAGKNSIDWVITMINERSWLYLTLYPLVLAVAYLIVMPLSILALNWIALEKIADWRDTQHFRIQSKRVKAQKGLAKAKNDIENYKRNASNMKLLEENAQRLQNENNEIQRLFAAKNNGVFKLNNLITTINAKRYEMLDLHNKLGISLNNRIDQLEHLVFFAGNPFDTNDQVTKTFSTLKGEAGKVGANHDGLIKETESFSEKAEEYVKESEIEKTRNDDFSDSKWDSGVTWDSDDKEN